MKYVYENKPVVDETKIVIPKYSLNEDKTVFTIGWEVIDKSEETEESVS